jgi:hypothetical protein
MLEGYTGQTKSARVWGVGGDCCRSRAVLQSACEARRHTFKDRRTAKTVGARAHRRPWALNPQALARQSWAQGEPERPRARAGPDSKGEVSVGAKRAPGG